MSDAHEIANSIDGELLASLHRARHLVAEGALDQAIQRYRDITVTWPDALEPWRHLGLLLAASGDPKAACACFQTGLALAPDDLELRHDLAEVLTALSAHPEAVVQYQVILDHRPEDVSVLAAFSAALAAAGENTRAARALETAHALAPDDVDMNSALGQYRLGAGEPDRAIPYLAAAMRHSAAPAIANNLATAYLKNGDRVEARRCIETVLQREPTYAIGWHTLGLIALDAAQPARAVGAFRKALALEPGLTESRYGLAQGLKQSRDYDAACREYEVLRAESPPSAELLRELAHTLERLGRYGEAVGHLEAAVALSPDDAPSWSLLGICHANMKRPRDGIAACRHAIALTPERPAPWIVMARCHCDAGEFELAADALGHIMADIQDDAELLTAAAVILEAMKQQSMATRVFRRVLELRPGDACATSRLLDISLSVCDWRDYDGFLAELETRIRVDLAHDRPLSVDIFNLQALPLPYTLIASAARNRAAVIARDAAGPTGPEPFMQPAPGRQGQRIRLGYALAYTHKHSLPLVLKELVSVHDRDRFEVFGYSIDACDGSAFSQDYRAAFDHFADVPVASPAAAAAHIHHDQLDLLIDTTGLTSKNCMPIMSLRPAPVQAHAFGYSITTGADYIDYLITDQTYVPPELAALGPEAPVYLPDCFMPTLRPHFSGRVATRADYGLPVDAVVFANFNHPCKFEPSIYSLWMRLLLAVPDAAMWFGSWLPETQANLRREAEVRGVDGARLVFSPIVSHEDHCARLALADLALDNRYHGGGVTTVDALWVGLPVVTLRGATPAARLGATLSSAAGLEDLVVDDLDAYERLAVALASDPTRRAQLRARLLENRETSALFDTARFRRHFECAISMMVDHHRAGQPPARIDVPVIS